ncbi:hypothetical protein K469DRAFT_777600 [Zopfia rhizophila CBS 207.26]|uniref:Uncharacterized protein n=1 Tax=Zopfia rhizophila CBS 207.26 TaxID=1314779 RepID=A0A6A6E1C3_9PEZI|nr:hypothetical protein K469DRAFT_777600 [Zopfia rhizophila CBS 207.26]
MYAGATAVKIKGPSKGNPFEITPFHIQIVDNPTDVWETNIKFLVSPKPTEEGKLKWSTVYWMTGLSPTSLSSRHPKEASGGTMELHDDDPNHFEFLLKFLYDNVYDNDYVKDIAGITFQTSPGLMLAYICWSANDTPMGRTIAVSILENGAWRSDLTKCPEAFNSLIRKYPIFAADLILEVSEPNQFPSAKEAQRFFSTDGVVLRGKLAPIIRQ